MAITAESIVIDVIVDSAGAENSLKKLTDTFKKIGGSTSSANSGMDKTAKTMNKLSLGAGAAASGLEKISKTLLSVATVKLVANALGDCITKANEYVESYNLFTVAMGSYANEAEAYAERVSDALGIDTAEWERAQGTIMTLVTGFGSVESRAYTMSKNLTQLGYDLSSFFNISVKDAMAKIESGIAGELEPLRRLGYDLSQAKLEAVAASLGINKLVSEMTQAEKAELRYYAIMTQVTKAQGDMARTIDSPANQLRVLKAQFEMLGRAIGSVFIPILNKVLPPLIAVVRVLREIVEKIAEAFGYEMPKVDYNSVDNYSKSVDDTTKGVKDLKRELMGFDEINKLGGNNDNLLDAGGLGFDFDLPEYDFLANAIENKVDSIMDKIKSALAKIAPYIDEILLLVETVAVALLAWKLGSFIAGLLTSHAKLLGIVACFALLVAGVALIASGIYEWVVGGELTGKAFWNILLGISLVGLSLSILFKSVIPVGIAAILAGVLLIIKGILDWKNGCDLTWGSIAKIVAGVALVGLGILVVSGLITSIPALVVVAIGTALTALTLMIIKFQTKIKAFLAALGASIADPTSHFEDNYEKFLKEYEDKAAIKQKEREQAQAEKNAQKANTDANTDLFATLKEKFKSTDITKDLGIDLGTNQNESNDLANSFKNLQSSVDSYKASAENAKTPSTDFVSPTATSSIAGNTTVSNLSSEEVETAVERGTYAGYSRALKENGSQPIQVTAQLNGRTLFEEVVNQNRTASKRYGKSPLSI